ANEGYLLTATERRSVMELARLVGYKLHPGVSASVYLAFTLEKDLKNDDLRIEIPAGTRAQSVPGPGELPQAFETKEAIPARTSWNAVKPRMKHPQLLSPRPFSGTRKTYLRGIDTNLKVNDRFLLVCGGRTGISRVLKVEANPNAAVKPEDQYTVVDYQSVPSLVPDDDDQPGGGVVSSGSLREEIDFVPEAPLARLGGLVQELRKKPSLPPANRLRLQRPAGQIFNAAVDLGPRFLLQFNPLLRGKLYTGYASAPVAPPSECEFQALRVSAAPFGHNAPLRLIYDDGIPIRNAEWPLHPLIFDVSDATVPPQPVPEDSRHFLALDAEYPAIKSGSLIVIDRQEPGSLPETFEVIEARTESKAAYGISGKVTQLTLDRDWLTSEDTSLELLRRTRVYAQSELLELAEQPILDDVAGDTIPLDGLYDSLEAGRWLVVSGERTGLAGAEGQPVEGVRASELVMLAAVTHDVRRVETEAGVEVELPGDTLHTTLTLAKPLEYTYKRETVEVNANVAEATHGETRQEVLGSGDGSKALQQFTLKQSPLTYLAAPTPRGVQSTLEVRVNEVEWHEKGNLVELEPNDRGFITQTDNDGKTSVIFGDGRRGARLPTGAENVKAVYRSGIGKPGNLEAERISQLASKPLGVKEVINPIASSGGADPESRDQARRNAPLGVTSLDRVVSLSDYADFARTFAGIAKASAARLSDGRRQVVHLTIAGSDDIAIEPHSDLYRNLRLALRRLGDPYQALQVEVRELKLLVVSARVQVMSDYRWESVEPKLRKALLEAFSFERRDLGQDALLSEVFSTAQAVEGVAYMDIDLFDSISEREAEDPADLAFKLQVLGGDVPAAPSGEPFRRGPFLGSAGLQSGRGKIEILEQPRNRIVAEMARINPRASDPEERILPAQLAYLSPDLSDTLILTEVTS
ncbi:MAG TPA: putative baseplate assembly protein, partial [Acidobacteriota bacterium]|nr:putative baseplate assembly protein [Acidobacteriota bacterium]